MNDYAVIDLTSNLVDNVVLYAEGSGWQPPENHIAVLAEPVVTIGWGYVDGKFVPPYSGVINIGREGLDLNPSYIVSLETAAGYTQSDLELVVFKTGIVLPYRTDLPAPYHFDSAGNCFQEGFYVVFITNKINGDSVDAIVVPEGNNVDVPFGTLSHL